MTSASFQFLCRAKTAFGVRAAQHLPFDLASAGVKKPFVLLDHDAPGAGYHKELARAFDGSAMPLGFAVVEPDTPNDLENLYRLFTDKGFDAIIAMGTGKVMDFAKALNLACAMGPRMLRQPAGPGRINRPLLPLVYLPILAGPCTDTAGMLYFRDRVFVSPYLMPDLVVISPDFMLAWPCKTRLTDSGLAALAVCCRAVVLSNNPCARAYACLGIRLAMENLLSLVEGDREKSLGQVPRERTAQLAHAAAVAGYLFPYGKDLGDNAHEVPADPKGRELMLSLLDTLMDPATAPPLLEALALPLTGEATFSSTPSAQRGGLAISAIQNLLNTLFYLTGGRVARTRDDLALLQG